MKTTKFSLARNDDPRDRTTYRYPNTWERQQTSGPERLKIAPSGNHVGVLLALSRVLPEPFGVLYVLLVPRRGNNEEGRYQNAEPASRAVAEGFLRMFRDFFEGDGRHHIWLMSIPTDALLVYDNHNAIFAYGPLDRYIEELTALDFHEGGAKTPYPHTHHYNAEYDDAEDRVLAHWEWKRFPLAPGDDD